MKQWKYKLQLNEEHLRLSIQYSHPQLYRISIPLHKNAYRQYSINKVYLTFINQKNLPEASTGLALWDSKHNKEKKMITSDIRIENSQLMTEGKHVGREIV